MKRQQPSHSTMDLQNEQPLPDINYLIEAFKKLTVDLEPLINKKDLNTFYDKTGKFLKDDLKVENLFRHKLLPQTSVTLKIKSNDEGGSTLKIPNAAEESLQTTTPKKEITVDEMKKILTESSKTNIEMMKIDADVIWEIRTFAKSINQRFTALKQIEISMKQLQYELGLFLHYAKQYCAFNNFSFFSFIDNEIIIKSRSQINHYIQFYHLCKKHKELLFNSLSCDFIIKNNKIICKALENQ